MTRGEQVFAAVCLVATVVPVAVVLLLICATVLVGLPALVAAMAGGVPELSTSALSSAVVGTLGLLVLTAAIALPLGIGAAIYLELEPYGGRAESSARLRRWSQRCLDYLDAIPSVLYGLVMLELLVRMLWAGRSLAIAALTMALVILPRVVLGAREALRAVPTSLREAALALGSSPWEVVRGVLLPMALPNILTRSVGSLSRAVSAAAPLVVLGGVVFVGVAPAQADGLTVLPVQIFAWLHDLQAGFSVDAAASVVVLLVTLLVLNGAVLALRGRLRVQL